jgi:hypothetical protein
MMILQTYNKFYFIFVKRFRPSIWSNFDWSIILGALVEESAKRTYALFYFYFLVKLIIDPILWTFFNWS